MYYLAGTGYTYDILGFTLASTPSAQAAGVTIEISISGVTTPPVAYGLTDDWGLTLKTSTATTTAVTGCDVVPCTYADYDTAAAAPLTGTWLTTTTAYSASTANSVTIEGTADGLGVTNAEYQFTFNQ